MWGTHQAYTATGFDLRFIPTYVGNAGNITIIIYHITVHPHVCGERPNANPATSTVAGSSPRMWGTPLKPLMTVSLNRFIPTYVGNAVCLPTFVKVYAVHPHVCGERSEHNTLLVIQNNYFRFSTKKFSVFLSFILLKSVILFLIFNRAKRN